MSKSVAQASNRDLWSVAFVCAELAAGKRRMQEKEAYYFGRVLIGKLLIKQYDQSRIYDEVKEMLFQNGKIYVRSRRLPEPSLGNGGETAACFLDSINTRTARRRDRTEYHLGLFKQEFKDHLQKELPNPWIEKKQSADKNGCCLSGFFQRIES